MLLWQVDYIYDFAHFFPSDRGNTINGYLIFFVEKNVSLFRDQVVKII